MYSYNQAKASFCIVELQSSSVCPSMTQCMIKYLVFKINKMRSNCSPTDAYVLEEATICNYLRYIYRCSANSHRRNLFILIGIYVTRYFV